MRTRTGSTSTFACRNTIVREAGGEIVASLVGHALDGVRDPTAATEMKSLGA